MPPLLRRLAWLVLPPFLLFGVCASVTHVRVGRSERVARDFLAAVRAGDGSHARFVRPGQEEAGIEELRRWGAAPPTSVVCEEVLVPFSSLHECHVAFPGGAGAGFDVRAQGGEAKVFGVRASGPRTGGGPAPG